MKKSKIEVTFDSRNLPCLKAKNITHSQLADAALFLNGVSRQKIISPKKKPNKIAKFFRCLYAATKETRADRRYKEA